MKAILLKNFGGVEELYMGTAPDPPVGDQEVRVKVHATALNRADLLQRRGLYPPPPGESEILGLEMAGTVTVCGKKVRKWKPGDRVFALLAGGGYAAFVSVHEDMLLPVPDAMAFTQAAAVAEAFLTAWQALVWLAGIKEGEKVLIHAGASGVGTAAIQIARSFGAKVAVTASGGKHPICLSLGAEECIDYRKEDFEKVLSESGPNVIIDFIGAPYFSKNIRLLQKDGRMVMLGFLGGTQLEKVNIAPLLMKRLTVMGSTLRSRTLDYKIRLTRDFAREAMPLFESRQLRPVVDSVYDWQDVKAAHAYMEANKNEGKIVMEVE